MNDRDEAFGYSEECLVEVSLGAGGSSNLTTLITLALAEDFGDGGDLTARLVIPDDAVGSARFVARAPGVLAGFRAIYETGRSARAWFWSISSFIRSAATASNPARVIAGRPRADADAPGDGTHRPELPPAPQRDRHLDRQGSWRRSRGRKP